MLRLLRLSFLCLACSTAIADESTINEALRQGKFDQAIRLAESTPNHYLHELITNAREQKLANQEIWLALLHYKPKWLGGYESQVDGIDFFTSERGKKSPENELFATLASFFSHRLLPPNNQSGQCRFRARYSWLKQQLHFDSNRLPEQECQSYEFFYDTVRPVGATIVFPAEHPNSPSSMFGHTLIRLDRAGQTDATRMLDYTINFAAEAGGEGGVGYAVKGLSGGFEGRFKVIPYHMKLREYAQMENRDIWEYRLDIQQSSLDFMVMHAWELIPTYFDYYFFTENCAYHLLSLLEPGLPEQELTDSFDGWVLPIDTLRLMSDNGMLKDVSYHPSRYRIIQARRVQLSNQNNQLALRIAANGTDNHLNDLEHINNKSEQAQILDLAFDYMRYTNIEAANSIDPKLNDKERALLLKRSQLKVTSEQPNVLRPNQPDRGHKSARLSLGYGGNETFNFWRLNWRAVYHDWLDPTQNLPTNYALEFANLALRYYTDTDLDKPLELEHFHLLRIDNLEPRDVFFKNISWRVTTGVEDLIYGPQDDANAFILRGGGGSSYRIINDKVLVYGLLEGDLAVHNTLLNNNRFGVGPAIGAVVSATSNWKLLLSARYYEPSNQDYDRYGRIELNQSWNPNQNLSFRLELKRHKILDEWNNEAIGSIHYYY